MTKQERDRQKQLRCVLLAMEQPEKIQRSETLMSRVGFVAMFLLLVVPAVYFRDLGFEKYVLMLCSATAGMLAMFWQYNTQAIRELRNLHEFVDVDKLKAALEGEEGEDRER